MNKLVAVKERTVRAALGTVAFSAALVLGACNIIDNQKVVSEEDQEIANPAPVKRDFEANNRAHKVILGVIDTGTDYNHPVLRDNIHFDLDSDGNPVGAGKDFTGDDAWPSPYVVRTAVYDPAVGAREKAESRKEAGQMRQLISHQSSLERFLDPKRNAKQEYTAGGYHGTHVAGLMVYDRPDFGLRTYRVLPQNKNPDAEHDYTTESVDLITSAMAQAAEDGARVVNMSLGMTIDKALEEEDGEDAAAKYQKLVALFERVNETARKYPDVLFVSAAGNDGAWRDSDNKSGLPCGIDAPNSLCVGALRENGDPTTFTNITLNDIDLVFALGHKVLSTLPVDMCTKSVMQNLLFISGDMGELANKFADECGKHNGMGALSGTSMASPLVARVAASILAEQPSLNGEQLIEAIYEQAQPSFIGNMPVFKLRIRKPSWYTEARENTLAGTLSLGSMGLAEDDLEGEYWEGFLK